MAGSQGSTKLTPVTALIEYLTVLLECLDQSCLYGAYASTLTLKSGRLKPTDVHPYQFCCMIAGIRYRTNFKE